MKSILLIIIALSLLASVGGIFWYLNQNKPASQINTQNDPTISSPVTPGSDEEIVNYALEMNNYAFSPALIEAEAGETIKVKLTSIDMPHNFIIDELDIQSGILSAGGDSDIVEITIPEDTASGTEYEFYCGVGNHRQLGMVGVLRVR